MAWIEISGNGLGREKSAAENNCKNSVCGTRLESRKNLKKPGNSKYPPSPKKANPGWKPTTYVVFFIVNNKLSQEKNQS